MYSVSNFFLFCANAQFVLWGGRRGPLLSPNSNSPKKKNMRKKTDPPVGKEREEKPKTPNKFRVWEEGHYLPLQTPNHFEVWECLTTSSLSHTSNNVVVVVFFGEDGVGGEGGREGKAPGCVWVLFRRFDPCARQQSYLLFAV